jgi:hypothetical protein
LKEQTWNICAAADYPAAAVPVSCGKQEMEKVAESEITFSISIVNMGSGGGEGVKQSSVSFCHGLVSCKPQVPATPLAIVLT